MLRKAGLPLIFVAVVMAALLVFKYLPATRNTNSVNSGPAASPSPTATSKPAGAGQPSRGGLDQSGSTPTPATSNASVIKPIGQLLNKTMISLSAADSDGQHNASMVSTVITASPGSTNTIVATGPSGAKITVGKPILAGANGQGPEISWNAKTVGLNAGVWQLRIQSQIGTNVSLSDAAQLTVQE